MSLCVGSRALRRTLLWSAVLIASAAGAACGTAPPHAPDEPPAPAEAPAVTPAGPVGASQQERLIRGNPAEYFHRLAETVLPLAALEIEYLLLLGRADRLTLSDFYHLHVRYPKHATPSSLDDLLDLTAYALHYHTLERPHELRQIWARELIELSRKLPKGQDEPSAELIYRFQKWAQLRLRDAEDRRIQYQPAYCRDDDHDLTENLNQHEIEQLTRHWNRFLKRRGYTVAVPRLADKLRFVDGPSRADYEATVVRLFQNRSIISRSTDEAVSFRFTERRFEPGEWHPATIYFGRIPTEYTAVLPVGRGGTNYGPAPSSESLTARAETRQVRVWMVEEHPLIRSESADTHDALNSVGREVVIRKLSRASPDPDGLLSSAPVLDRAIAVGIVGRTVFLIVPNLGELLLTAAEPGWALLQR